MCGCGQLESFCPVNTNTCIYMSVHRYLYTGKFSDQSWLLYWCFLSWQDLRTYEDGYRFVTVRTHGDIIVLLHWDTRLRDPRSDWNPLQSHYPGTELPSPSPFLFVRSTRIGTETRCILTFVSHYFHWTENRTPDLTFCVEKLCKTDLATASSSIFIHIYIYNFKVNSGVALAPADQAS